MNQFPSHPNESDSNMHSSQENPEILWLRTDSTGRIDVSGNWVEIFEELRGVENYYLQTRNAHARIAMRTACLRMGWKEGGTVAQDNEGRIELEGSRPHGVQAHLGRCDCCGSPGKFEFRSRNGLEVMRVSCPEEVSAIKWGLIVSSCLNLASTDFASTAVADLPLPGVPADARVLNFDPKYLVSLFSWINKQGTQLMVTLTTTGVVHRETLKPIKNRTDEETVCLMARNVTVQFALKPVRRIFLTRRAGRLTLYLAGSDDVQLLRIEPAEDESSVIAFYRFFEGILP